MADLNIALIMRLVDQATGPAQKSVAALVKGSNAVGRAGLKSLDVAERMSAMNKRRNAELRGQTLQLAGLGATFYAAMRPAIGFEKQMDKVGSAGRMTADQVSMLSAEAQRLGAASAGWRASQVGEGMEYLALAGFDANQVVAAMPGLLNLASAAQTDLASSSDYASDILSAFGFQAEKMGEVGDILTNTFTSSNTKLPMLSAALLEAAPSAQQLGVDLATTAGMAGKLADNGIKGSKAGTALRAVFSRLAAATPAAQKELEKLNIQIKDADGNMRDFPTILAEMDAAMQGMGDVARADIMNTVFGLEAMNAASVLLGSAGSGALQDYISTLDDAGAAARVATEINENTEGSLLRLGSAFERISITVGTMLLPRLTELVEAAVPMVNQAAEWASNNQELVTTIADVTGAVFLFGVGLLALKWTLSPVIAAVASGFWLFGRLAVTIALVARAVALLATLALAHPIIALVAGLALGAYLIYKNWDGIKEYFQDIFDSISEYIRNIDLYAAGVAMMNSLKAGIVSALTSIKTKIYEGITSAIPDFGFGADYSDNPKHRTRRRAGGGPVRSGFVYQINENGQELFAPSVSGRVINARDAAAAVGQAGSVTRISVGDIVIQPQPGASAEDIAKEVRNVLRDIAEDADAALHDGGRF